MGTKTEGTGTNLFAQKSFSVMPFASLEESSELDSPVAGLVQFKGQPSEKPAVRSTKRFITTKKFKVGRFADYLIVLRPVGSKCIFPPLRPNAFSRRRNCCEYLNQWTTRWIRDLESVENLDSQRGWLLSFTFRSLDFGNYLLYSWRFSAIVLQNPISPIWNTNEKCSV